MLITSKLPLNRERFTRHDQVLSITGATWNDYQAFSSEEYPGYRVSYFQGEIIIVSPGLNHEIIAEVINRLIIAYCEQYDIQDFPFRQTRLEAVGQVGREPDVAYSFNSRKPLPDLAVEVIFSSGDLETLKLSYQNLGIPELWIWKNNQLTFYHLNQVTKKEYFQVESSFLLEGIKAKTLAEFVNRGFTESPSVIKKDFLNQFNL